MPASEFFVALTITMTRIALSPFGTVGPGLAAIVCLLNWRRMRSARIDTPRCRADGGCTNAGWPRGRLGGDRRAVSTLAVGSAPALLHARRRGAAHVKRRDVMVNRVILVGFIGKELEI